MKIAVAMSGGVDSSVAALILKNQGHEVVGFTMHNFNGEKFHFDSDEGPDVAVNDAKIICKRLGIPHHTIFLHANFQSKVIDYFVDDYSNGNTPNPCTMCNPNIKWGDFLKEIQNIFAFDKYATGHYAKIIEDNGIFSIYKASDDRKDQTYMLWGLSQDQIKKTIFPLSDYSKKDIRKLAEEAQLEVASKKDSQEICFIKSNYKDFLKEKMIIKSGDVYHKNGQKIGIHKGYLFYTIGQRRWLNIPWKSPLYVMKIMANENRLIVTDNPDDLLSSEFYLKDINWTSGKEEDLSGAEIQIRYNSKAKKIKNYIIKENKIKIISEEKISALTPGQSGVIYKGHRLIGGGIITMEGF